MKRHLVFVLLVGCGGGSSSPGPDAQQVPDTVTISGKAEEFTASGSQPLAGVRIGAYRNSAPDVEVLFTETGADGNYSITVPTDGAPIDGFFKASLAGYMDTYLYAPGLIAQDFASARVGMLTPDTFTLLSDTLCGANQQATNAAIIVLVGDATETPVAGATVGSSPAATKYCYNTGGLPNRTATATEADGLGYLLNVPPGKVTVSAFKDGMALPSHAVTARAGVLTTTLIIP